MENTLWTLWLPSSCSHGYIRSGSSSRTCQTSGNWNQQLPTCDESNKTTHFTISSNSSFKDLRSSCVNIFWKSYIWQKYFTVVTCPPLSLTNGEITYDMSSINENYPVGTRASLICDHGYSQSGTSTRTCQDSGICDQQNPTCNQSEEILFHFP